MTMKSHPDQYATEVLRPVAPATTATATEKLAPVSPVTEKLNPVVAAIPAQRRDSRPSPTPRQTPAPTPAPQAAQRPRWEHLATERHPLEASPQPAVHQSDDESERHPQRRLRAAQLLVQRTTDLRAVPKRAAGDRPVSKEQAAPGRPVLEHPDLPKLRWQRSALTVAPAQGTLATVGFAACDYLIRTVSILGLLAVVGMVTAGTSQTQTQERAPGTTVATSPAHPGAFSSTHHQH